MNFLLNSFRGGFSEYENKGLPGAFKSGRNLDIRKDVDSLSCQQALVEEGADVIVDLIMFFVPCTDGNTYGFGNKGNIYKRTSAGVYTKVYTDPGAKPITGAAEWFLSTNKTYLFWATDTYLHCKEIPGNAGWTDVDALATYPKTTLTNVTWHTMTQAVGTLQIANGHHLAMVGWDGSFSNEALNIFPKNYVKTLIERGRYVVIGAPSNDLTPSSELFSWDTDALDFNDNKPIKGGAVNAMIDTDLPLAQIGTDGGIYYADFQNILPIVTIPEGGYCNPGAVVNDDGLALFGISDNASAENGIYSYGRKKLNQNRVLNLEYYVGCDELGAICKVGSDILVSYQEGSDYFVAKVDDDNKATVRYYSLDLNGKESAKLDHMPVWGTVVLNMKPLPSGCSIRVYYKLDKTGDFIAAKMEGNVVDANTAGIQEATYFIGEKANIIEFYIVLTPYENETPEIFSIDISFE